MLRKASKHDHSCDWLEVSFPKVHDLQMEPSKDYANGVCMQNDAGQSQEKCPSLHRFGRPEATEKSKKKWTQAWWGREGLGLLGVVEWAPSLLLCLMVCKVA